MFHISSMSLENNLNKVWPLNLLWIIIQNIFLEKYLKILICFLFISCISHDTFVAFLTSVFVHQKKVSCSLIIRSWGVRQKVPVGFTVPYQNSHSISSYSQTPTRTPISLTLTPNSLPKSTLPYLLTTQRFYSKLINWCLQNG